MPLPSPRPPAVRVAVLRCRSLSVLAGALVTQAFQQFGDIVSCRLVLEPRELGGRSQCYGFIQFGRRTVAAKVQQLLSENLFMIGSSPRPVRVDFALDEREDGLGAPVDSSLGSAPPPHFAQPGTLEFDFALKWRELSLAQQAEAERLAELHRTERETLRAEQRDEYLRDRDRLLRLDSLHSSGYSDPKTSSQLAHGMGDGPDAKQRRVFN